MSAGADWEKTATAIILFLPRSRPRINKPLAFILLFLSWIPLSMHAAELIRRPRRTSTGPGIKF